MRYALRRIVCGLFVLALPLEVPANLVAGEGDPMAIRSWPGGAVSLETQWGLNVAIAPAGLTGSRVQQDMDQVIATTHTVDHVLLRQPNEAQASWLPRSEVDEPGANAIQVKSVPLEGSGTNSFVLRVDGVKIAIQPGPVASNRGNLDATDLAAADLLVLLAEATAQVADPPMAQLVESIRPKLVLLCGTTYDDSASLATLQDAFDADKEMLAIDHNTLAISNALHESMGVRIVTITDAPWKMPADLAREFAAMEEACRKSQEVFAELSTNQMNFKPANGTHTPRWNTEHMMGRQLLFFSQIYHAQNPLIPVIDLNPRQMPGDYTFAHPDWGGREEARQMRRVSEFTKRFAFLLSDIALEEKAPGSDWPSLQALLRQMHRHYSEHTTNTIEKFDLPGWPAE